MVRRRILVHGHVQGVGFRWSIARAAQSRGVSGWVANRPDGTVEAVLEGDPDAVESVVRLSQEGPRGASVQQVEVVEEEPEQLTGFVTR